MEAWGRSGGMLIMWDENKIQVLELIKVTILCLSKSLFIFFFYPLPKKRSHFHKASNFRLPISMVPMIIGKGIFSGKNYAYYFYILKTLDALGETSILLDRSISDNQEGTRPGECICLIS